MIIEIIKFTILCLIMGFISIKVLKLLSEIADEILETNEIDEFYACAYWE